MVETNLYESVILKIRLDLFLIILGILFNLKSRRDLRDEERRDHSGSMQRIRF